MAVIIAILIVGFLLWPQIKRWMAGYMARKTEDFIRSAAGMPPRDKGRKAGAASSGSGSRTYGWNGSRRNRRNAPQDNGPIIPREYAEDVEFVETVDYSETVIREDLADGTTREYRESQVSDAEYVEIKG